MKLLYLLICVLFALPTSLLSGSANDTLKKFRDLETRWVEAIRDEAEPENLRPMLEEMIANDFVYQHGSGQEFDKARYIELLTTGGITVTELGPLELHVRDYSDVVISYGISDMAGRVFYEYPYDGRLRFVNIWRKDRSGSWRLHHRNSELLDKENNEK